MRVRRDAFPEPLWPDAEERTLLRAGLLQDDRAIQSWTELGNMERRSSMAWALEPLAFYNLSRLGVPITQMPDEAALFSRTTRFNRELLAEARPVLDALTRAGIPTVLLKGAALVHGIYPHIGARPMFDVDVLVPSRKAIEAADLLAEWGFVPSRAITGTSLATRAGGQFVNSSGWDIDLHWHALGGYLDDHYDQPFWVGAKPTPELPDTTHVLGLPGQLIHVTGHAIRDGRPDAKRLADSALILRAPWTPTDWRLLGDLASTFRLTLPIRTTLEFLERIVGLEVPTGAWEALERNHVKRTERLDHWLLARLNPHGLPAALARSWTTYAATQRARHRKPLPLGFAVFTWRYLGAGSFDRTAGSAIRRKLTRRTQ